MFVLTKSYCQIKCFFDIPGIDWTSMWWSLPFKLRQPPFVKLVCTGSGHHFNTFFSPQWKTKGAEDRGSGKIGCFWVSKVSREGHQQGKKTFNVCFIKPGKFPSYKDSISNDPSNLWWAYYAPETHYRSGGALFWPAGSSLQMWWLIDNYDNLFEMIIWIQ